MHGADDREAPSELLETSGEMSADDAGVLLQVLVAHDVEHGEPDPSAHRAAARRREEAALGGETVGDRPRRDDGAEGMPVAHRLRDGDDVGHHPLLFAAPEVLAEASVADLHFVGDAEPAATPRTSS